MNHFFIRMRERALAFLKEKDGASAIEYAIIAGLIAVAIIGGATALGGGIDNMFETISNTLKGLDVGAKDDS